MKNGSRGPPILLKRPKDATILKVHAHYKTRSGTPMEGNKVVRRDKSVRMVRTATKPIVKQREKLVCPVCGILTYTLGNHIATHQGKLIIKLLNIFNALVFLLFQTTFFLPDCMWLITRDVKNSF